MPLSVITDTFLNRFCFVFLCRMKRFKNHMFQKISDKNIVYLINSCYSSIKCDKKLYQRTSTIEIFQFCNKSVLCKLRIGCDSEKLLTGSFCHQQLFKKLKFESHSTNFSTSQKNLKNSKTCLNCFLDKHHMPDNWENVWILFCFEYPSF